MIVIGIILSFILGLATLLSISSRFQRLEYIFISFPLGIGIQTIFMLALDWVGVKITLPSTLSVSLLAFAGLSLLAWKNLKKDPDFLSRIFPKGYQIPKPNLAWIIFMVILVWFEYMNFYKTAYLPTFDTDSIRGYDFMGKTVAVEGTLKNLSLFTDPNYSFQKNAGLSSYTPFAQLAYAYAYLFGSVSSKIISATLYLCFLGMFYSTLKRITTHTAAAFFTLMMMITPEMLAFSALSGVNVIHASFASVGLIYAVLWFNKKDPELLAVSALLLCLNCYTRNEGIVFSAMASLLVLFRIFTKDIHWSRAILFFIAAFFGFIYWNLFIKINGIHSGEDLFIYKPFWDPDKIDTIVTELSELYFNSQYYGIGILVFALLLVANLWNLFRKGDQVALVVATLGVIFLYTLIIYQINYVWDNIENVLRYSYKRFLFSFIPLLWYYIATNRIVLWTTQKADRLLYK
jgi:hypothetical protein